jgi:hypothetical protein
MKRSEWDTAVLGRRFRRRWLNRRRRVQRRLGRVQRRIRAGGRWPHAGIHTLSGWNDRIGRGRNRIQRRGRLIDRDQRSFGSDQRLIITARAQRDESERDQRRLQQEPPSSGRGPCHCVRHGIVSTSRTAKAMARAHLRAAVCAEPNRGPMQCLAPWRVLSRRRAPFQPSIEHPVFGLAERKC